MRSPEATHIELVEIKIIDYISQVYINIEYWIKISLYCLVSNSSSFQETVNKDSSKQNNNLFIILYVLILSFND